MATSSVSTALARFFAAATYPILFTGAGVSTQAGLPTWTDFVTQLAEALRPVDPLTTEQILECIRDGDLTRAVGYFWLSRKMVDGDKSKNLVKLLSDYDPEKLTHVARLPFRGCLTTNFDKSILDAIAIAKRKSASDYKLGDASFREAQWDTNLFVARIHGAIENPNSIVLSDSQFDELLKNETYGELLRENFLQRNVLFLGFSFYDPAIKYVLEDLERRFKSSPPGRHMALLPRGISSDFARKAGRLNIEIVEYNPDNRHSELWEGISEFSSEVQNQKTISIVPKQLPFDHTRRYLAACYARAAIKGSASPLRESLVEGIVSAFLQEAAPSALARPDIEEKIRLALGLRGDDAKTFLDGAIRSLLDEGLCRRLKGDNGKGYKYAWNGPTDCGNYLETAIGVLTESIKSRAYLEEGWTTGKEVADTITKFFNHLVRQRGWDLGAAFTAGRAPEGVAIEAVLNDSASALNAFDRERLLRICSNMFAHPSQEESDVLGELGRVSFAVELAFHSPRTTLLHKTIFPKLIYFDASVLLPALVEGHPFSPVYKNAIKKLKDAAARAVNPLKLRVCTVYLNEIISHRRNAIDYYKEVGADFPAVAHADAIFHGVTNTNVFVGAYANWTASHGEMDFQVFLNRVAPYNSEIQLRDWLKDQGFEIISGSKQARFAEFYSHLEVVYANSLAHGKGSILIEHDAIQLNILESDLERGERAIFVSADRQLQKAASTSKFPLVAETMISHVGLVQLIELVLGGMEDGFGLTELLWSSRISERSKAVRSYFTTLGLQQYDAGLAMAMPSVIERFSENTAKALKESGADLDSSSPKRRAEAFRTLGSLEQNYLSGMQDAVEKLQRDNAVLIEDPAVPLAKRKTSARKRRP
jgi:hypothetical protein